MRVLGHTQGEEGVASLTVPGDKSVAHRALLCGALASGSTTIEGVPANGDVDVTIRALRGLGVVIEQHNEVTTVHGVSGQWPKAEAELHCGSSGTTLRLMTGLLAGSSGTYVLTASSQLARRPIEHVLEPLRLMGASIERHNAQLRIIGKRLHGICYACPLPSAQLKSSLVLAALSADAPSTIIEPTQTRNHLEVMLPAFGGAVGVDGHAVAVTPGTLRGASVRIPGDISSAAPWIVGSLLFRKRPLTITHVGLNRTRLGMIQILQRMGGRIDLHLYNGGAAETVGDITVHPSDLHGVQVTAAEAPSCIDEIPLIAMACTFARGPSAIAGVSALRGKESDRLQVMLETLPFKSTALKQNGDVLEIVGPAIAGQIADNVQSGLHDHRMTVLISLLGLANNKENSIAVPDPECVDKSYPGYWRDFARIWPGRIIEI